METSAYYPFGLPLYVLLLLFEWWLARRRGVRTISFAPSVSNVTSGVGSIVMGLVLGPMWLALYAWGSQTFALFHFRAGSLVPYALALVLADLAHYWNHRMDHRVAMCWAIHGVHHQSKEMNFTTGMRHGWFSDFFSIPFYAPLTLVGIELRHFFFATVILSLHALITHSAVVRFPSFGILVTPQSHSLHHARNAPYADRNFAVMFSLWDRLFGTYVAVDPAVPPIYGTSRGYPTHDGIRAQWVLWGDLFARARQVHGLRACARIFLGRPTDDGLEPQRDAPASRDIPRGTKALIATCLGLTIGASLYVFLGRGGLAFSTQLVCGALILLVMSMLCGVLDGKRPSVAWSTPFLFLLALMLAGCSRTRAVADTTPAPADAAIASAAVTPLASSSSVTPADAGPKGPTIELKMPGKDAHAWSLDVKGLPALSADGTQILFVVESDPDQRGYPNDAFDVRRVSDDLDALQLKGFDGYELGSADDDALRPAIERRAAALHTLLAREAWTPMKAATAVATNVFAQGELRFTLNGDHAALTRKGAQLGAWDASTWRRPDIVPDSMSSSTCVFIAELARVHIDEKAHVVAATVHQRVRDTEHTSGCIGPDDTHALRW